MGKLKICSMFSLFWSLGQEMSTLGLKTSLHILLTKANHMTKPDNNEKYIPPSEKAPRRGTATIMNSNTTFHTLYLN